MELGSNGQDKTNLLIPGARLFPPHNPVMLKPLLLTFLLTNDNITLAVMTRLLFTQQ